ncbi:hypothetical protein GF318_00460 [Candidatus Micrarchaeota archaeon]|nr:hypothetical protein [Candidatus Micrarchaeota archaeon]
MPGYKVELISQKTKEKLMKEIYSSDLFERKASIHGTCIKLFTDSKEFRNMWDDNFEHMPEWIRPHARLFAVSGKRLRVRYEPISKTAIVEGCGYYGWIKSIALAIVADFMEDFTSEHRRYSVHGSFVDYGGRGAAVIGPSGSGKTTLTYGLMRSKGFHFLTDDWFFVRLVDDDILVFASERNSYIRCNLGDVWPEFRKKLNGVKADSKNRAIVDVKRMLGTGKTRKNSTMEKVIILTREKDKPPLKKLSTKAAMDFMLENDFCNPHQMVRNKEKMRKRKEFFHSLFRRVPVYLLNTVETPEESLDRLKGLLIPRPRKGPSSGRQALPQ